MSQTVKSAKGVLVNFDLIKIKQQMASAPKPTNVKAREDFIDQKFKRRLKKLKRDVMDTVVADESADGTPEVDEE